MLLRALVDLYFVLIIGCCKVLDGPVRHWPWTRTRPPPLSDIWGTVWLRRRPPCGCLAPGEGSLSPHVASQRSVQRPHPSRDVTAKVHAHICPRFGAASRVLLHSAGWRWSSGAGVIPRIPVWFSVFNAAILGLCSRGATCSGTPGKQMCKPAPSCFGSEIKYKSNIHLVF